MTKCTFILLLMLLPAWIWSQQEIEIKGTVVEEGTEEPAEFATIKAKSLPYGGITDENGQFQFRVPSLPDSLEIRHMGTTKTYAVADLGHPVRGVLTVNPKLPVPQWCMCEQDVLIEERSFVPQMDRLAPASLRRNDGSSVEQGMNLVPGVKFESRGAGGSRRLVVRGGFLRSPFGVRDVKVYFAGAPLTSPDGSTPLELIDAGTIASVEVKKGPFSSEYGAVSNGVVMFEPGDGPVIGKWGGQVSQTLGSYGYARTSVSQVIRLDKWRASVQYVHQLQKGYRDQESNAKDFLQASALYLHNRHTWGLQALAYKGNWGLPGALDSSQVAADPRQALPYSKAANAHVQRQHLRFGAGHQFYQGNFRILNNAYLHLGGKENPYGTGPFFQGYKFEQTKGFGDRTELSLYETPIGDLRGGFEFQTEWMDFKEFENLAGQPGPARTISHVQSTQAHAYVGLSQNADKHRFYENISLNQVAYKQEILRSADVAPNGSTDFKPAIAFSGQYAYNPRKNRQPSLFFRVASGFSPPALWEMTDSNGTFNQALRPEKGLNLELRAMKEGYLKDINYASSISFYHHLTYGAIVPQTLGSGRTVFANLGNVRQVGVEGSLRVVPFYSVNGPLKYITLVLNGTYQHFRFLDYELGQENLRGKAVPGAPVWTANLQADLLSDWGAKLQITLNAVGKNFLDNANAHFQPSYLLLNAKISQTIDLRRRKDQATLQLLPFVGGNNLLNAQYTNFPQLNATNGRFWNPAPGMNFFAGLDISF